MKNNLSSLINIGKFFVVTSLISCSPILKAGNISSKSQITATVIQFEFTQFPIYAQLIPQELPIPVRKRTTFKLYLWNKAEELEGIPYIKAGLTPHVWLWMEMKSGSHGSSVPAIVSPSMNSQGEVVPGAYDVTQLVFTMPREWQIHLELKQKDGTIVDEVVNNIWI